ncbi:outer dense fiber protein 3-like [Pecten maximus]|uniref:outer dense fiber protein 3-like n=1 Tax=Pecten maximus TaxID=6579 RepID=UPI0014582CED|nr:outer dense fiber protein 3-like [Pecten maximus]
MAAALTDKRTVIITARERGPGPGRYALPSSIGFMSHDCTKHMKPAYSFGRRLYDDLYRSDCSPGPAYFIDPRITRHGTDGTPAYSMLARQHDPNTFKTPSPGAYSPEQVHPQGERHAARYSISARTPYRQRDQNPSPNKYCLPPVLGNKQPNKPAPPAYFMSSRQNIGSYLEDLAKAPGPGQYNGTHPDSYMVKAPLYSMRSRSYMPGDNTKKPGPGQHSPERVSINKQAPPQHSLGIRHSEFICPLITEC